MYRLLFHKDVFVPNGIQSIVKSLQRDLKDYQLSKHFSEHLNNQAIEDRSHTYIKDIVMDTLNGLANGFNEPQEAFEIELSKSYNDFGVSGFLVTKYCIRLPYDENQDLVIVIRPGWNKEKLDYDEDVNLIVTAWMNSRDDAHFTLDASKYCSEQFWNTNVRK